MGVPWVTVTVAAGARAARDFFCPVCGLQIYGEAGQSQCPHLLLAYIEETGAFDFCRPDLDRATLRTEIDGSDKTPVESLAEGLEGESVFLMRIEARSDVSGPSATVIGIDMKPRERKESR